MKQKWHTSTATLYRRFFWSGIKGLVTFLRKDFKGAYKHFKTGANYLIYIEDRATH